MNFSTGLSKDNKEYNDTLAWLYSQLPMFSRIGAAAYKPGLDNTLALDELFGHPHKQFKSIHIAGTNGKGSTSHNIAAILQSEGYKTGLYTSPHLVDFRERIRINGKMIPHDKVVEFVNRWKGMDSDLRPSFFELTMMMAFDWFAAEKVDYAVIEVGMGGRLDSTNIITPELCIITNISKDHTQFLGSTPEAIAHEKAGIIKSGVPVVIGEASGAVKDEFKKTAEEKGAPVIFAEEAPKIHHHHHRLCDGKTGWELETDSGKLFSPLAGDYQLKNLNTVLYASSELMRLGIITDPESIRVGIKDVETLTGLAGRWMIVNEKPMTICDTGHNIAGLKYNFSQLERLIGERESGALRIVLGFVADKAIDDILQLLPKKAIYYITQASIPRALDVKTLDEKFKALNIPHKSFDNVTSAASAALADSSEDDIIYIGGSTFVVADYLSEKN